jgi:hypothetical protein
MHALSTVMVKRDWPGFEGACVTVREDLNIGVINIQRVARVAISIMFVLWQFYLVIHHNVTASAIRIVARKRDYLDSN